MIGGLNSKYENLREKCLKRPADRSGETNAGDPCITAFQVGGAYGIGAMKPLIRRVGSYVKVLSFDESPDNRNPFELFGTEVKNIQAIIGKKNEIRNFYHNTASSSNGLFEIETKMKNMRHPICKDMPLWGEHANCVKTSKVETTTLDYLRSTGLIEDAQFMSIDVQGAELEVLQGALSYMSVDVLGVVLEVEMSPIYHGQCLFDDTCSFLRQRDFAFYGFYKPPQEWHPYIKIGKGRFVVAEALYLKDFESLVQLIDGKQQLALQMMKLARIAFSYKYDSYGFEIMNYVTQKFPEEVEEMRQVGYIGKLIKIWKYVEDRYRCWPKL